MNKNLELIAELMETGEKFNIADGRYPMYFENGILKSEGYEKVVCDFNRLTVENIMRGPWEPRVGKKYFFASPFEVCLYAYYTWNGTARDLRIQQNIGIFATWQEALEDAKKRGWKA